MICMVNELIVYDYIKYKFVLNLMFLFYYICLVDVIVWIYLILCM